MTQYTCRKCGTNKTFEQMIRDKSAPSGCKNICKDCQRAYIASYRAKVETIPEVVKEPEHEVVPTVALPRTHHYRDEYRPEPTYVRNEGLKHIKSKGF